ncbi:MAG: uroporphyrinogen decarboxylase family protein [Anaerolineae bacterium]
MNSRDIVTRTINYTGPSRLAGTMPAPYWNDTMGVSYSLQHGDTPWRDTADGWQEFTDIWGNTWARVDRTSKGEVVHGVIEDGWEGLANLQLPDLANPFNYNEVKRICADQANEKYRIGGLPGFPFNVARYMRRLENFLADILWSPDEVAALLGKLENLLADVIYQYAQAGTDGIMFCEDWGTQLSLMINPRTWRQVFKPGFVRLCQVAHQNGQHVLMHSCGKITDIIPDLIEAGIDVLQFDQPRLHGIDTLARFHGAVTFWCPVDIQQTLQRKDEALIAAEANELVNKLGGSRGGFIAGYYSDNPSIGLETHWQDVACQTFARYDHW